MSVEFSPLTDVMEQAKGLTHDEFAEQNPAVFLVAMGVLAVRMSSPPGGEPATFDMENPFQTARHKVGAQEALAGHVFKVHAGSGGDAAIATVGRESDCDVMVPDPSVSARHAELRIVDNASGMVLVDLDSRNGTSLNNERVASNASIAVRDGDLVTFGRYSFTFYEARSFRVAIDIFT